MSGSQFHFLVDFAGAYIEGAAEDAREGQEVIDLVGEVGAPCADHPCTGFMGKLRHDFRRRVCHAHDDGILCHGAHHFLGEAAGHGNTDEDIGILDDIGQGPLAHLAVRDFGDIFLEGVHALLAAFIDGSAGIAEQDILHAKFCQKAGDGLSCCTGAVHHHANLPDLLLYNAQGVQEGGGHDDGCAVLVVMEDGDIKPLFQLVLDDEAFRSLDVLKVDAAEGGSHHLHRADDFLGVLGVEADRHGVYPCEPLEQYGLAFHDRQPGTGTDGAEAQDGGAVGDDGHHITLGSVVIDCFRLIFDGQARRGYARRVGQGQILGSLQRYLADDFQLALALLMQVQCSFVYVFHIKHPFCAPVPFLRRQFSV